MSEQNDRQRQLAVQLAQNTPPSEREALRMWAGSLLELRQKDMSVARKTKEAILITHRASVTWPILKVVYTQIKKYGWDNRSTPQRLGLGAAGAAFALFGSANAGIAALGGAIGVPLWVVFGAGAMFAHHLYEELSGSRKDDPSVKYKVFDAEKELD